MRYVEEIINDFSVLLNDIVALGDDDYIFISNTVKEMLYQHSPLYGNPVDCVVWVKSEKVVANDYNPNTVAAPEMKLLEISISEDGYTQPIVTFPENDALTVIDGFHRNRVGKESELVRSMVKGYLPVVRIKPEKQGKDTRIASTIRHNRARGKHRVDAMSDIVLELKNRNWTNARISKELGMEEDEILRLCQITGLANLFSDEEFSRSWDIEGSSSEDIKFEQIDDSRIGLDDEGVVTQNTSDPNRVFHTYDKWECYRAGFYATHKDGMKKSECEQFYAEFLGDLGRFERALIGVTTEWVNSCEHYLTNAALNRIAWLGQASVCYESGIPSQFCSGFNLLTGAQQDAANNMALTYLNLWLEKRGVDKVDIQDAMTVRTSTLY